jgi:hypothetical protein
MDDDARRAAPLSALTTEHFVLQTASTSTISEAAGRSSVYILALSSSLVAMGFLSESGRVDSVRRRGPARASCSAPSPW